MTITSKKLHHYFEDAVKNNGKNIFLKTTSTNFTFDEVYKNALFFQNLLEKNGVLESDRIVIYSSKNSSSISMMIASSKINCIYVPVSSMNPSQRAKYIITETAAKFIVCDTFTATELLKSGLTLTTIYSSDSVILFSQNVPVTTYDNKDNAAFILYTSGSTGTPKGVVISHEAAIVFTEWASHEFEITGNDLLASIAPFNFDLSVFDIYVTAKNSASLFLYSEDETKNAHLMAQRISIDNITTIYATPTFYSALAFYGKLNKYSYSSLKNILFAGEVFHLENFKILLNFWPNKNYANLYGPTETNVCTFFRIDTNNIDYPFFPIGKKCDYATLLLVDENNNAITEKNIKGELLVAGKSLFNNYWNDSVKTKSSLFTDENKVNYYRTGDIVYKNDNDLYVYVSRKDRMIKKNGFRIEPLEIENVMMTRKDVSNVAVCFSENENQLVCFLESKINTENTFIELKQFCLNHLPSYMVPDKFVVLDEMPKTSSGKIDLQELYKQIK